MGRSEYTITASTVYRKYKGLGEGIDAVARTDDDDDNDLQASTGLPLLGLPLQLIR